MCLHKMENWSDLCDELLELIMGKLSTIEDVVHFGAVCRRWRSVSVENRHLLNKSRVAPWLMLAEREDSDRRAFYSLSAQKVYYLNLPETRNRQCWSFQDWLITLGFDWDIQFFNPFSKVLIRLPPDSTLFTDVKKVVFSSTPSPSVKTTTPFPCEEEEEDDEKCLVIAICFEARTSAFLRLGEEVWRAIETPMFFEDALEDVIYFNDQFYAVDCSARLYIFDISSLEPKTILFAEMEEDLDHTYDEFNCDVHLVESVGELLMVVTFTPFNWAGGGKNISFINVYKLNFDNREWEEVKSLENRALFVANISSFAIFSPDHHPGCELNCVYFSYTEIEPSEDEIGSSAYRGKYDRGRKYDRGVYRMETQEIEFLDIDFYPDFCTPLWICPSL